MKRVPRTALLLAATLAAFAVRPGGFALAQEKKGPAPPTGVTVSCRTFLGSQDWPTDRWVPCLVTATNLGAAPVRIRMGVVPRTTRRGGRRIMKPDLRDAVASTKIEVPGSSTKKFFLYVPPQPSAVLSFLWTSEGVFSPPSTPLFLANVMTRYCLVIGEGNREEKIAKAFKPLFPSVASTLLDLPDRPEGYDPFHTIILHDFDPSSLSPAVLRSLREWTVRGGLLVLAPGKTAALFEEPLLREIHPFRSTADLTPRVIRAFGELDAARVAPRQPVHRIEGGEVLMKTPRGDVMVRGVKVGLGACLALATTLDVVDAMTQAGRLWFIKTVLLFVSKNATPWATYLRLGRGIALEELEEAYFDRQTQKMVIRKVKGLGTGRITADPELGQTLANAPCFRNFPLATAREEAYDEELEELNAEFHVNMIRGLTGIPGIGLVTLFLIVFMAVVGPANYWFLRRKRIPALSAVTVPLLSVAFVGIVILMGLVMKGGTKGNRLAVYETRSGQRWAARSALTCFRTGREGMYTFGAGEGIFPLPSVDPQATYRLEQGGEDRLLLPLDRWVVSGIQTETAVRLQGMVEATWESTDALIANGLSVPLQGGLLLPPPTEEDKLSRLEWHRGTLYAKIPEVPAGGERRLSFRALTRWEVSRADAQPIENGGRLSNEDKLLLTLLEMQKSALHWGGAAFWIAKPFPAPTVDGGRIRLLQDRAGIVLPFDPSRGRLARSGEEEGREKR
ncbi:MAG: hypothetical protein ACYS47_14620 [Planctomycetota bacterium]